MSSKSILLKGTPLLLAAAGVCLYPLRPQHAQVGQISMPDAVSFRVLLGVGDTEPTVWDGSVKLSGGQVTAIQGWRFAQRDSSDYKSSWKASTRRLAPQNAAAKKAGRPGPIFENGVVITAVLSNPQARYEITTPRGGLSFTAQEIPLGESKGYLDGSVTVDRVPSTVQLTTSDEEQDFPAIAQSGDDVYLTYVEFTHANRTLESFAQLKEVPGSFDYLKRPTGGDQVMLMHYSKSRNTWDPPRPVSAKGQDVMRTAVAVDGSKRVWAIWSANQKGNFDIYAAVSEGASKGAKWSTPMRVTSDPGTDVNPVAATDAQGRVWIAWQAFRNGNLEILSSVQSGVHFGPETTVSFSPKSDWDPAIATSPSGEVAVSWDTYDKGDYDVYFRRLRAEQSGKMGMDQPTPVAASQNFEARSSVVYDAKSRLWVAYEASERKWGKDFGAYETTGVALYQGHTLKVKCFAGGDAFAPAEDVSGAIPGAPAAAAGEEGRWEEEGPQRDAAAGLRRPSDQSGDAESGSGNQPHAQLKSRAAAAAAQQLPTACRRFGWNRVPGIPVGGQPAALADGQHLAGGGVLLQRVDLDRAAVHSTHRRYARRPLRADVACARKAAGGDDYRSPAIGAGGRRREARARFGDQRRSLRSRSQCRIAVRRG